MRSDKLTVSIDEAERIILRSVNSLGGEIISILEAPNRVLYEDIVSDIMIPPLACSAMDGYAIIAGDTRGASMDEPARLEIIGETRAGGSAMVKRVTAGTAVRIMTGAPMPEGADAVARVEDTEEDGGTVKILRETVRHQNYRMAGESINKRDGVLYRGDRLRSADIGILASLNYDTVKVYRRPTVSIISTGDELAGIGEEMDFGKIRDVNAYALYAEAKKYGALPEYLGIARDTFDDIKKIFVKALKSDVVISTGGVSMGKYDFVREIYADLDIEVQFERVNVKPGKPCALGTKGNKLVFGLPGNPVSALTSFIQFVRPALLRLMGANRIAKPIVKAILQEEIRNKRTGKVHLLRGRFTVKDNEFHVVTTGSQKSSIFRSMSEANCLIIIPDDVSGYRAGDRVAIQLIDHDEI